MWTTDQQQVIDERNANILVSAAAGSGKTAVLVERIVEIVLDKENPVDIDRLLIVTFTKAAASEMRERIGAALENALRNEPGNEHLIKQLTLIHRASITTIDSFCLNVVKNNFTKLDLDPSFKIADETELALIKSDVMSDILEESYSKKSNEFIAFIESYGNGKSDVVIEKLITNLYKMASSNSRPITWLENAKYSMNISSTNELFKLPWFSKLLNYTKNMLDNFKDILTIAQSICNQLDGPIFYLEMINDDIVSIDELISCKDYNSIYEKINNIKYKVISRKKGDNEDPNKREEVKALRQIVKDGVKELAKKFFYEDADDILDENSRYRLAINGYIDLTIKYYSKYFEKKAEKNIYDFNDIEHMALRLLVNDYDKNGNIIKSDIAKQLSEFYSEIMIDEYQDSNFVQEDLLCAVSKNDSGRNNMFMVGDVKQSIYKFRMARPDIFMGKYKKYSTGSDNEKLIELKKNFRSKKAVLDGINYIFYQLMRSELGDIEYTNNVALDAGLDLVDSNDEEACELMLVTNEVSDDDDSDEIVEHTQREMEAKAIAKRIKELVNDENPYYIFDKKLNKNRKAEYKDIVILLRTISGWGQEFYSVLMDSGIPCHTDSQKGYFDTIEIRTILSLLSIIDNSYLDIEFTAVLRSPICQLTGNQLAKIKIASKKQTEGSVSVFEQATNYIINGDDIEVVNKLTNFMDILSELKELKSRLSIHDLLWHALNRTGYFMFVSAMPSGEVRKANILMLIEKAVAYEKVNYHGLFNFIRYIEKLKEYDIDFGETKILGENDNLVRITSIHKSKGLEYPVVFLSGLSKSFNNQDANSSLVLHPDYYIGPTLIDTDNRMKSTTILRNVLQKDIVLENIAEELRILYVALTRSRDKLIMTGVIDSVDKLITKYNGILLYEEKGLPFFEIANCSSYLDFIVKALIRNKSFADATGIVQNNVFEGPNFLINIIDEQELIFDVVDNQIGKNDMLINVKAMLDESDNPLYSTIKGRFEWKYPFMEETKLKSKFSVTELKKMSQYEDDKNTVRLIEEEVEEIVPHFISNKEEITAAQRGTAVHKIMELIDFTAVTVKEDVDTQIQNMIEKGQIEESFKEVISISEIYSMIETDLGNRMKNAMLKRNLFREQQFIIGIPMSEVYEEIASGEEVLVQGIIDAYFIEDNKIVLMDYKTDKVSKEKGEEELVRRYKKQLDYYGETLEKLTNYSVTEKYIYSFTLNKAIRLL